MPTRSDPDDRALEHLQVLRAQMGDRGAYARLFERYHPRLLRYVQNLLGNAADAEDVMQDVWVTVVRKIGTLQNPPAFQSWIYRIARNRCMSRMRSRSFRHVSLDDVAETVQLSTTDDPGDDEDAASTLYDRAALEAGMARLSVVHREALTLRFIDGLTYEEIAAVTSRSIGTVRSRVHYGRKALHTHISVKDVTA